MPCIEAWPSILKHGQASILAPLTFCVFSILYVYSQHYFCLPAMACYEKFIFYFCHYEHLLSIVSCLSDLCVSETISIHLFQCIDLFMSVFLAKSDRFSSNHVEQKANAFLINLFLHNIILSTNNQSVASQRFLVSALSILCIHQF